MRELVTGVSGGIDLHGAGTAVGNKDAVEKWQEIDAMIFPIADDFGCDGLIDESAGCGINTPISPRGVAASAGGAIKEIERLDGLPGHPSGEIARPDGSVHDDLEIAGFVGLAGFFDAGGLICVQDLGRPFWLSVAGRSFKLDGAAEDDRAGDARLIAFDAELGSEIGDNGGGSTNGKQGLVFGNWSLGSWYSAIIPFLDFCGEFAKQEMPSRLGLGDVLAGAFEDDFGSGVVGDFDESGGEGILPAQWNAGTAEGLGLWIGPLAIGHASDSTDEDDLGLGRNGDGRSGLDAAGDVLVDGDFADPSHGDADSDDSGRYAVGEQETCG